MVKCDDEVERIFRLCDVDGDGKISVAELRRCVAVTGGEMTVEEAETMVNLLDSDGDGLLGLNDFVGLLMMSSDGEGEDEEQKEKEMKEAFGMYLMEGSKHITPKSLKRMLSRLGKKRTVEECVVMISRFDLNGDGVLSFDEFRVMIQ